MESNISTTSFAKRVHAATAANLDGWLDAVLGQDATPTLDLAPILARRAPEPKRIKPDFNNRFQWRDCQ